jgi:thiamine biosynthesis lipoprotein
MKKIIIMIVLAAAAAATFHYREELFTPKGRIIKRTRFMMDTLCTIQVPNELGVARTTAAINKAFDKMAELEKKFNCTDPASPIYAFNERRTPITDPEIAAVVGRALEISRDTDGAFDPTVQPLVDLWGFFTTSASSQTVPSPQRIREALAATGWRRIIVKDGRVTAADPRVKLDLGGIAKGYAIGEAMKVLKAEGVKSALLIGGGQVQLYGSAGPGLPWKIGLRNPRKEGYLAGLAFDSETGISTSGDYERYFEVDGVRYHHILDPKTGYPARGIMSMSVITQDPMMADALSTALFVMGQKKAIAFAKARPGMGVILVNSSGAVVTSGEAPGMN